jgi:hypothetical protein
MKRRILAFVLFLSVLSGGVFVVPQTTHADTTDAFNPVPSITEIAGHSSTVDMGGGILKSGTELKVVISVSDPAAQQTNLAALASSYFYMDGRGLAPDRGVYIDFASDAASMANHDYLPGSQPLLSMTNRVLDITQPTQEIQFNTGAILPAGQTILARIRIEPAQSGQGGAIVSSNLSITTPPTVTGGVGQAGTTQTNTGSSVAGQDVDTFSQALDCSITNWTGCIVSMFYEIVYKTSAWIVTAAGWLMNVLINFSISSFFYTKSTFVTSGWGIVRDIANLFFIFALLYAGISTIVSGGGAKVKSVIIQVVLIALAVNFSLFVTRVIIDVGNITARIFYTNIAVTGPNTTHMVDTSMTNLNEVDISAGLTQGLSIQRVFSQETVNLLLAGGGLSASSAFLILILGIVVNLIAAWTFFFCGFLMIGRIIGLWFAMIFSPIAFVSRLVNIKLDQLSWSSWFSTLTKLAFMPTIFLFFIYIIMLFISSPFLDGLILAGGTASAGFSADFAKVLIGIAIQFAIIIAMIGRARKLATDLSGDFGKSMASIANMAGGLVIGAATGGVAMLGKQTIGRGAMMASQSEALKARAAKGGATGWIARQQLATVNNLKDRTFDARNGKVMGFGLKDAFEGAKIKEPAKGGFQTLRNTAMKNKQDVAKTLEVSADEPLMKELYEARKGTDKERIKNAEKAIADENKRRKNSYADVVESDPLHRYGRTGASETANSIRKALTKEDIDKDEEKATTKKEKDEKKKRDDDLLTVLNNLANHMNGGQNNPPPPQQNQSNNAPGNTGGPGAGPTVQFTGGVNLGPQGNTSGQAPIFTRINTGGTQSGQERTPIGFRASAGGGSGGSSGERTPIGFKFGNQSAEPAEQRTVSPGSYSVERASVPKPPTTQATNPQPQRNPIGFRKNGPNDEL